MLAGQEVGLALSHLRPLQQVVPAAVVSSVVSVHRVGSAGRVGGLPGVLLDHVHRSLQGEECQTPDSSDGHLIKALLSPRPSQLLESAETVNT